MNTKNMTAQEKSLYNTAKQTAREIRTTLKKNNIKIAKQYSSGQIRGLAYITDGVEITYNIFTGIIINCRKEDNNKIKNIIDKAQYKIIKEDNNYITIDLKGKK